MFLLALVACKLTDQVRKMTMCVCVKEGSQNTFLKQSEWNTSFVRPVTTQTKCFWTKQNLFIDEIIPPKLT